MKLKISLLVAVFSILSSLSAMGQSLRGRVTDAQGAPLPGASVLIQGTSVGTVTGVDGTYTIDVASDAVLEFAFFGMKTQVIKVNGRKVINVTLEDDATTLNEVVIVGYGSQQKADLTNAVSSVKGAELLKAPAVGVTSMVGTRVAGVVSLQQSGQPGSDAASLLVRGQSAVCVVDGVVRDINEIDTNEIESVSVLKDATSAAMYGLNSNAVILVTTKRGDVQKARISYNGEYGISQNTGMLTLLDGPNYAYWYNKSLELDAQAFGTEYIPVFTAQQVQYMKEGSHGWGNTDWYGLMFGTGTSQHHNISATGGSDKAKFFTSVGYLNQKGNVTGYNFERFNLRSNVDAKLSDDLDFTIDIAGRIEQRDSPRYSANPNDWHNIPQQAVRALPFVPTTYEINGIEYGVSTPTNSSPVNPLASIQESGYSKQRVAYLQTNSSLTWKVPFVKGLTAKFMGSYDMQFNNGKVLSTPFQVATLVMPTRTTEDLKYVLNTDASGNNTSISEGASWSWHITTQSSINYEREFGKSKVKALALMETRENKSHYLGGTGYGLDFIQLDELNKISNKTGSGSEKTPTITGYSGNTRTAGFVGRLNYSYADRYLLEGSFRYDGSYVFGSKRGTRWVALPGVSAGWKIHNEDWFNVPGVDVLKLRGSIGKTANSSVAASQYMDLLALGTKGLVLGGTTQNYIYASTLGNPDLTWSKVLNYDAGFDLEMWNGLLGIEADVFYKYEYDILSSVTGAYSPSRGGYYFSYGNENKKDYKGFDLTIRHNNYIGDFNYGAKLVLTYAKRRWLYYAGDSDNTPDYFKLTGKEVGSLLGFIADGLFKSDEDVANSAVMPDKKVAAGYIKYVDRNGDGKITYDQDMGYIATSAFPKVQGSLNLYANWKGFDVDMLWQGAAGRTISLTGQYTASGSEGVMDNTFLTKPFYHGGNSPLFLLENSWTPENPNGEFPRPSITPLSTNNAFSSSFWYRDGSYLRLKTMQIGYTVPQKITRHAGVSALRFYIQGSNLLTFSGLTKYGIDPEQPGVNNGYYPQQKVYQLGVKLTF